MYLVDFIKKASRTSNVPVFIYLVLNVFIIIGIIAALFEIPMWEAVLIGLGLYTCSLAIALSPIGEWILRLQNGCKRINRVEHIDYIEPIFKEVYENAKLQDPTLSDKIELFISDDESANAFAVGRKTICMTKGLMEMPEEQIKAVLAHEFGHLSHKDTDLILLVSVGNLIVTTIIVGFRLIMDIFRMFAGIGAFFMGADGIAGYLTTVIYHAMLSLLVSGLTWIWTKIGIALVMKSSRQNEYEADEFSYRLGYGYELCMFLDSVQDVQPKGLFAAIASSHPSSDDRIAKLQNLGCKYRLI